MLKWEELTEIINTKHPEWKRSTVRELKELSGYSHNTCYRVLKVIWKEQKKVIASTKSHTLKPKFENYSNAKKLTMKNIQSLGNNKVKIEQVPIPPTPRINQFTKIDDVMIETLLLERANSQVILSDNFIRTCIVFYKDLKGLEDVFDKDFDLEWMLEHGKPIIEDDKVH